ncbi:hypothetical protein LDENG_00078750 [Lucifuga dentata]|nr:hypothetical protein LDENG_00078750 [Lucifuga dentata]
MMLISDIMAGYCFHCSKLLITVCLVWTAIQDRSEHFDHSQRQMRLSINWSYWSKTMGTFHSQQQQL